MPRPADGARYKLDPDPPIEGLALDITYIGPALEIEYQIDSNDPVKLTPDADGKVRIDSLPRGAEIIFSDNRGLPGYLHRDILSFN